MIEQNGRVVALEGEFAWVETRRESACGSCAVNKGCGTSALDKFYGGRRRRLRAHNPRHVAVGDEVVVGIDESTLVASSFLVYLLPLVLMLLGGGLAEGLAPQWGVGAEAAAITGGLAGLLLGFFWLRRYSRRLADNPRYQPRVVRRCAETPLTHISMHAMNNRKVETEDD